MMNELEELYRAYLEKVIQLEKERKPGDGLFGIGKSPADDPCHDKFAEELENLLNRFAVRNPESAEIREVVSFIYRMSSEHREPASAYWMLNAVHGLTLHLIARLLPNDAKVVFDEYKDAYPRAMRLPVQKKVYLALKKASSDK